MREQYSPPFGILVQFSSKTWSNLFPFRRQDGTLDSSVAVGVALRPGEGESQGGGARRAPARQVALGQEVDGQEEDVNVAHHGRQDPLFVQLSYLVGKELGKPSQL